MSTMALISQFSSPCWRSFSLLMPVKETLPTVAACCNVARSTDAVRYQHKRCFQIPFQRQYHTKTVPVVNISGSVAVEDNSAGTIRGVVQPLPLKCYQIKPTSLQKSHFQYYHTTCTIQGQDKQTASGGHQGDANTQNNQRNIESLIETWFYEVCPYGAIEASLPFKTVVKPLHPQEHPDMNKVIIQLHFDTDTDTEIPDGHQLSQMSDLYDLKVAFDEDKANMKISCDVNKGVSLPVMCTLQVPLKYDLKLKMTDARDLSVQKMESSIIVIDSEKGNCHLNGVKCGSISAVCRSGNIVCKSTLLGNIYFHTGKSGSITTEKLQGSNITCETEMGSVVVKSLYADNAIFRSDAGHIHLGHCHGQLYMQAEKSHFRIESLDGDLDIGLQSGSVEAHLSRHNKADVEVKTGGLRIIG